MRLPALPSLSVMNHVNETYFSTLWNAPLDHGRVNFRLIKAQTRIQTGAVSLGLSVVGLPTTDKVYAVYKVGTATLGKFLVFLNERWTTDAAILKQNSVSLEFYTDGGRVIPPSTIYLRYDEEKDIVLIAIPTLYTKASTGRSYPDLSATIYFDTSRNSPTQTNLYQVTNQNRDNVTLILNSYRQNYKASTRFLINGFFYDADHLPSLDIGDLVTTIYDPDIIGYCDISVDDNQTGYYSNLYGEYREVLHIPKVLNPNQYIITTDTLYSIIYNPSTYQGVLGHRLDTHALEPISHQDYSMSRTVLQAFQNSLGAQNTIVRLYVRYATNPLSLEGDANRLNDLYALSDNEIKQQLIGLSSHQINEWKAAHLEQSSFLDLIYRYTPFIDNDILARYANAVGYYDLASTLSQTMKYYTYQGGDFVVTKPVRLAGIDCDVMIYANGRKILQENIIRVHQDERQITLRLSNNTHIPLGTRLGIYVTEDNPAIPTLFTLTAQKRFIRLDSDDYQVIRIFNYTNPKSIWQGQVSKGYAFLNPSPGDYTVVNNNDGTATYTFSSKYDNQSFYLIPNYGLISLTYSLDPYLLNKQPLIFPLFRRDATNTLITLVEDSSIELYLNGYRLVEDVDYRLNKIEGDNQDLLQLLVEISNQDYLDLNNSGNVLEIMIHGDQLASRDRGYVIQNLLHRTAPPMIWSKSCGRAFVRGRLIENVNETGNIVVSSENLTDGALYLLEWTLPYSVKKLLNQISPVSDLNLRGRIDTVLDTIQPVYPDYVQIPHLHALYSPYLAQVTYDVAQGLFTIADDPINDSFLNQFSSYDFLKSSDPILDTQNLYIDRRFVTLAAHYVNLTISNPQQMRLLQKLIQLTLTPSELAINEVLI